MRVEAVYRHPRANKCCRILTERLLGYRSSKIG